MGFTVCLRASAVRISVAFLLLFALLSSSSWAQEPSLLRALGAETASSLSPEQERRAAALAADSTRGAAQFVSVNTAALRADTMRVAVSGDSTLRLRLQHKLERGPGDFTWIGSTSADGGQTVLVVRNGEITGVIYDGLQQYSLSSLGGGLHALTRIDHSAFPPDHPAGPLPQAPREKSQLQGDTSGDGPVEIDFLGVYTPEAAAASADIEANIQLAVDMANASYLASNANVQLRLVGTMLSSGYSEAGKSYNDLLYNIRDGAGALSAVHVQRNALGADLVGFFVNHRSYCGLAYVNSSNSYAYSVTTHVCVSGHTFAHELGHNFGALHDIANSSNTPPYLYGYGYIHPQGLWRTIQSYAAPCGNCPRIGNFSNPSVNHNGHPTGTVTQHDVARVHRERAAVIAAFRATSSPKAVMSTPAPGSTITTTSATFNWTAGSGVASYWLYVGNAGAGSANIFSGGGAQTSRTVTGLPVSGTLNVRLMSYIGSAWQFNDYTYTMSAGVKAVMTSPTPGSTLTGSSATFSWTAGSGVASYWLMVGNNGAGSANILSQGGAQTSRTVNGLPASGTLNVRLMSYIGNAWQFNDYAYTMTAAVKAVMTWPTPGSVLTNPWASFTWTSAPGSSGYWLMLGTNGAGSANILSTGVSGTTRSVTGLPQVGTLNVRLMTYAGGGWQSNDYTYTMAVPAMMSTPTPGSTLPGPGVMFQWTGHASIASYWLYVGTGGAGSSNIFSSSVTNTWRYVGGLPASGTVNVRLTSWVGGAWRFRDYTYTGGAGDMALEAVGEDAFSSLMRSISLE